MEQLTRPDLSRAYLAILHDAERLENSHLDPADARTPEFQYLVFLMHHIVQKALQGQTYSSTSGSTSERLLELYENLKQNWLPKVSEERQVVSADDCLCWLVRLVARHQKPKTPGRRWVHESKVVIVR